MGLILWIDKNTFATSLLEKIFKKKNFPFYTISGVSDFLYLVEDLKPSLIVLDAETLLADLAAFQDQYQRSVSLQELPLIVIDPKDDLMFLKNKIGEIKRPFDPFQIPQALVDILKKNEK